MRTLLLLILTIILLAGNIKAQNAEVNIYNPAADAKADIAAAVKQANAENKHVLLQIGGNWCPWCVRLHGFIEQDYQIDSLLKADYIRVMVNYSKEVKNLDVMTQLENPQRFGFPVLVVLNQEGKRIHTQDSWYLEKEKSYDKEKLIHFLKMWDVAALDAEKYKQDR